MGSETIIHYDTQKRRINTAAEILTQGIQHGLIVKAGRMYKIGSLKKYEKDWVNFFEKNPKKARVIANRIMEEAVK